ncbi:hypothetical protein BGZ46_003828 [Entomortierella lignicola]|nr:hypothetical protein BGZ46_003828 [Entomortierella lignicola]
MTIKSTLSLRAQDNLQSTNLMLDGIVRVNSNKYNEKSNPTGIINLGVAENQLMTKELVEIMSQVNTADPQLFGYGESPSGSKLLRKHFANNIFNRYFAPHEPVLGEHIVIAAGCSSIVDNFTFSVCDPGEGILITTPFYGGFNTDIMAKSKCKVVPAYLGETPAFGVEQIEVMQQALDKANHEGTRVRAFVVSNPHNPLGRCYPREVIIEYLKFASKNQIHILFDEIYALSMFDHALTGKAKEEQPEHTPFISVLSLPNIEDYCEKELVHVAVFTWISSTTEAMITKLLEDPETIDVFTKTNQARLAESYTVAVDILREHNIPFIPAQGGHFLWMDLSQFIPPSYAAAASAGEHEIEYKLWYEMLDQGVYVNPGDAFTERKVGFYRLTFSLPPHVLREGLERMIRSCRAISMTL